MTIALLVGLLVAALLLARAHRRRAWQEGPVLVEQLRRWHAMESEIVPLQLPAVKPLQAVRQKKVRQPRNARPPVEAQKRFGAR